MSAKVCASQMTRLSYSLFRLFVPTRGKPHMQDGLLFGYPFKEVKQYSEFQIYFDEFRRTDKLIDKQMQSIGDKSKLEMQSLEKDKNLLDELERNLSSEEKRAKFLDNHKNGIIDMIKKYRPDFTEDAKRYIVQHRRITLRGFTYVSGNPTSNENSVFAQKVNDTFNLSGIDDFLKQATSE